MESRNLSDTTAEKEPRLLVRLAESLRQTEIESQHPFLVRKIRATLLSFMKRIPYDGDDLRGEEDENERERMNELNRDHAFCRKMTYNIFERIAAWLPDLSRNERAGFRPDSHFFYLGQTVLNYFIESVGVVDSEEGKPLHSEKGDESFDESQTIQNLRETETLLQSGETVVLMANHNSYGTGPIIPHVLGRLGFKFLADRMEMLIGPRVLATVPMRFFAGMINTTLLVRPPSGRVPDELQEILNRYSAQLMKELRKERGRLISIFPTGTRDIEKGNGDWEMGEVVGTTLKMFPKEAYYILCNIEGDGEINERGKAYLKKSPVRISVSRPRQLTEEELKRGNIQRTMESLMEELARLPRIGSRLIPRKKECRENS